jgi:hypothetical protein
MSEAMALLLTEDEVLALGTLQQMPKEEKKEIEDMAELIAKGAGITLVDAIVLLMKMGQNFAMAKTRLLRVDA